jgi:hypothetical protein
VVVVSHKTADAGNAAGDVAGGGVDLHPVAGGDDHPLNNSFKGHQFT